MAAAVELSAVWDFVFRPGSGLRLRDGQFSIGIRENEGIAVQVTFCAAGWRKPDVFKIEKGRFVFRIADGVGDDGIASQDAVLEAFCVGETNGGGKREGELRHTPDLVVCERDRLRTGGGIGMERSPDGKSAVRRKGYDPAAIQGRIADRLEGCRALQWKGFRGNIEWNRFQERRRRPSEVIGGKILPASLRPDPGSFASDVSPFVQESIGERGFPEAIGFGAVRMPFEHMSRFRWRSDGVGCAFAVLHAQASRLRMGISFCGARKNGKKECGDRMRDSFHNRKKSSISTCTGKVAFAIVFRMIICGDFSFHVLKNSDVVRVHSTELAFKIIL